MTNVSRFPIRMTIAQAIANHLDPTEYDIKLLSHWDPSDYPRKKQSIKALYFLNNRYFAHVEWSHYGWLDEEVRSNSIIEISSRRPMSYPDYVSKPPNYKPPLPLSPPIPITKTANDIAACLHDSPDPVTLVFRYMDGSHTPFHGYLLSGNQHSYRKLINDALDAIEGSYDPTMEEVFPVVILRGHADFHTDSHLIPLWPVEIR